MSWLLKTLKRWNTVTAAQMKKSVLIDKILSTLFLPVCFMPCIFYRSRWLIPTILKLKALYSQNMCTFINYWILSWFFFCSMYCRINGMEGGGTQYFVHLNDENYAVLNICYLKTQLSWKRCGTGSTGGCCNDQYQDRHWTCSCNSYSCCRVGTSFLSDFRYLQANLLH